MRWIAILFYGMRAIEFGVIVYKCCRDLMASKTKD